MDKKKTILIIITFILFIIVFILAFLLLNKYILKKNFEDTVLSFASKNENTVFKINKIALFSGCDAQNKNTSISNFTIENLYQYTDIALFFNSNDEKNLENTFKKVWIENIQFNNMPLLGEPNLYFKSINDFAKSTYNQDNIIKDKFEFNITAEDTADLSNPILYNNLANPITLSYINSNVKTDYTLTDTSIPITYDGSLLKRCNINLDSIKCNLSFDTYIVNNLDQEFKCTVYLDIPLENDENSIYDGKLQINKNVNFIFYRYK